MQDLALRNNSGYSMSLLPSTNEWNTLVQIAETVVKSGLAPAEVNTPQKALIIMLKARELGVPPMQALSSIHIVKGRPTLAADLMVGLLRTHGHKIWVVKSTDQECVMKGHRRGEPGQVVEVSFTIQDAKTAGLLTKDTYKQYPAPLLYARCASRISRMVGPEVLAGMHTAEELGADVRYSDDGNEEVVETQATEIKPTEPVKLYPDKTPTPDPIQPADQPELTRLTADEFKAYLKEMDVTVEIFASTLSQNKAKTFRDWSIGYKAANPEVAKTIKDWFRFGLHQYITWIMKNRPEAGWLWDEKNQLPRQLEDVPFEETPEDL